MTFVCAFFFAGSLGSVSRITCTGSEPGLRAADFSEQRLLGPSPACHQSKRVAASFTCSVCPVIRANVQTWGWSWSGYYSVTFQSPEPLLMFLKMRMRSPGAERDERPVDILMKSGLPGSTGNSAHLCRARKDPLFQASPRKGPFGCRGPSKISVFFWGGVPAIRFAAAMRAPCARNSARKLLSSTPPNPCSQMAVCG